ncbi:MAG: NAD(P)/FAD-dependent oxidoreductase [Candidatus Aminicenantales bacterium]
MAAMAYDVIVIGAGIGGLGCAAKLARNGCRVLVLETKNHIGGTSSVFRRDGFTFPMGPLSFSFPGRVKSFLSEVGVQTEISFRRNHFQLISPDLDIIYSLSLETLQRDLQQTFPQERPGLESFFSEFKGIIQETQDIPHWHPDYLPGPANHEPGENDGPGSGRFARVREYSRTSCRQLLERHLDDRRLRNFLGSQGTSEPEVAVLTLALMWNMMSEVGIWFPSCGIDGLSDLLAGAMKRSGGEVRLNAGVERILLEKGRVVGVRTVSGEAFFAPVIVSNADAKNTFLELCDPADIPRDWLERLGSIPYTGSELCVYLGIEPGKVDWRRMRATHLFYRHRQGLPGEGESDLENFEDREFEICRWSDNAPDHVPPSKASLILRVGFPYDHFARFRTGEKKRKEDYRTYKMGLAGKLITTAEHVLPGLESAVELIEVATPLTYADWGRRYRGSIAGWTWSAEYSREFEGKLLVETPIKHLFLAGIYAASELFLGGVPTALLTADLAACLILGQIRPGSGL